MLFALKFGSVAGDFNCHNRQRLAFPSHTTSELRFWCLRKIISLFFERARCFVIMREYHELIWINKNHYPKISCQQWLCRYYLHNWTNKRERGRVLSMKGFVISRRRMFLHATQNYLLSALLIAPQLVVNDGAFAITLDFAFSKHSIPSNYSFKYCAENREKRRWRERKPIINSSTHISQSFERIKKISNCQEVATHF